MEPGDHRTGELCAADAGAHPAADARADPGSHAGSDPRPDSRADARPKSGAEPGAGKRDAGRRLLGRRSSQPDAGAGAEWHSHLGRAGAPSSIQPAAGTPAPTPTGAVAGLTVGAATVASPTSSASHQLRTAVTTLRNPLAGVLDAAAPAGRYTIPALALLLALVVFLLRGRRRSPS